MQTTQQLNWPRSTKLALAFCLAISSNLAVARESSEMSRCTTIENASERLDCYDTVTRRSAQPASGPLQQLTIKTPETSAEVTSLSARWELDLKSKQGLWIIRPYEPMYILPVSYTSHKNESPWSPTHPATSMPPRKRIA